MKAVVALATSFLVLASVAFADPPKRAPKGAPPEGKIDAESPRKPSRLGSILRVHCSPDGKRTAIAHRRNEAIWVTVDEKELGPYLKIDAEAVSPFRRPLGPAIFRAKVSDGYVLAVDGTTYGPFEEVWNPETRDNNWGALVKKDGKYHLLVNGALSGGYDEIAGDHRLESEFDLESQSELSVPLLLSEGRWGAFARRGEEKFVVTQRGEAGPFTAIGDQQFGLDAGSLRPADLSEALCFDRSRFAFGVAQMSVSGVEEHWLIIDGDKHGPFVQSLNFRADREMSRDGSRWAFFDEKGIHTQDGTIDKPTPRDAVVSSAGEGLAYIYGPGEEQRLVVNGEEFGPFQTVQRPSFSPDGTRWVVGVFEETGGDQIILTPDGEVASFPGDDSAARPMFRGAQWVAAGVAPDNSVSFLVEGVGHGPYKDAQIEQQQERSTDEEWWARGHRADGTYEVFSRGKKVGTVGPYDSLTNLRTQGDDWSALARKDTSRWIIENGIPSHELPAFKVIRSHHVSRKAAKMALSVDVEGGGHLLLLAGKSFGPFPKPASRFQFSDDGTHWAFYVEQSEGKFKVFSDMSTEAEYDSIADYTMTERGIAFVATSGNEAWVHVGTDRHGPFDAAGLVADEKQVYAAIVEAGKVAIRGF